MRASLKVDNLEHLEPVLKDVMYPDTFHVSPELRATCLYKPHTLCLRIHPRNNERQGGR